MANATPIKYDLRLNMKVDQDFLDALDRLCAKQLPEMNRSDMIRKLVLEAARRHK